MVPCKVLNYSSKGTLRFKEDKCKQSIGVSIQESQMVKLGKIYFLQVYKYNCVNKSDHFLRNEK